MLDSVMFQPMINQGLSFLSIGDLAHGLADFACHWDAILIAQSDPSNLARWMEFLKNILMVVVGLGFVIFVHELGHFLAAKACGVKCEKFYVGFDVPIKLGPIRLPSKLFYFQWGETEYGIGAIPLGGYVKMLGQDDDPRKAQEEADRIKIENPNATSDDPECVTLDPRSFPAKSVFARMLIISAGVIMNLIFGVLMAACAYLAGVPYDPMIIGTVVPGDPGWENGLKPGDHVVKVRNFASQEFAFSDFQQNVVFSGFRDPKRPVPISVERDGVVHDFEIVGTTAHSDPERKTSILAIGVRPSATTKLAKEEPFHKYLKLGTDPDSLPKLEGSDVIVGVNGTPLPVSSYDASPLEYELNNYLHPRCNESLILQVQRDGKIVDVPWDPVPMKNMGLQFAVGPVVALARDSIAAKEGVQKGDSIVLLNGAPIADALTLPLLVGRSHGKSVTITLEKEDKSRYELSWTVPEQFQLSAGEGSLSPTGLELPGSGIAFGVSPIVTGVVPNTMAAKSGIQPGDEVTQIAFDAESTEDKEYLQKAFQGGVKSLLKEKIIDRSHSMLFVHNNLQVLRAGMPIRLHYTRAGKVNRCSVDVRNDETWCALDRGLAFTSIKKT